MFPVVRFATVLGFAVALWCAVPGRAAENVLLTEMPDYTWYAGCFGTASGNLMGYWDRHGFPDFYTGPANGGVAPLTSNGVNAGIRSMWATRAGFDGRPLDQPGHIDNYWTFYNDDLFHSLDSPAPDPYVLAGRPEHPPECIGDFIGLSQNKWTNLNGECDGNIDGHAVVFWELSGARRVNYSPPPQDGLPVRDIPSGLRAWAQHRGYSSEAFSQLTDFNPNVAPGQGFTFEDMKTEIDAGYPVMLIQQSFHDYFRALPGMPRANPAAHAMLAYGYYIADSGARYVRYKTSWGGSGDNTFSSWDAGVWQAGLPVRGVVGFRPLPQLTGAVQTGDSIRLEWHGPSSMLSNLVSGAATPLHWYVVERATALFPAHFVPVTEPSTNRFATLLESRFEPAAFYRVRLLDPSELEPY